MIVNLAQRLAEHPRRRREKAGLSQVRMANRLGLSRSTLNRLEAADQNAILKTLDRLCKALKCEDLFAKSPEER
jgi:transcriptional regulator with XRE-family HTH domain